MPAAVAVPLILGAASAGTAVAGATIAGKASKNAAKTQSAAGDRALQAEREGYERQRADFAPYMQQGAAAMGRLGQTAGTFTGGPPQPQAQRPPMMSPQGPPMGQLGMPPQGPPPMQGQAPMGSQPMQGMGPGPQAQGGMSPQMGQAVAQQPGGGAMPGALVKVRAPTGEIAMLPREMADRAVQKGAQVLP